VPRRRSALFLAALLAGSALLGACGDDDGGGTDVQAGSIEGGSAGPEAIEVSGAADEKPTIELNDAGAVEELYTEDIIEGDGDEVAAGDTVEVHYVGVQLDGTEFDSSWDRGQTATFALDQVIPGWTEGIPGMKVGGRRLLVVPSDMAYGDDAAASGRPAGTLVFVVDLVSIPARAPEPVDPEGDGSGVVAVTGPFGERPVVALNGVDPVTDVVQTDVIVGDGAEVPADGTVSLQLVALLLDGSDGGSTWDNGQPSVVSLAEAPPAFQQGLSGMRAGGRRVLVMPAAAAQQAGATVPDVPGGTVVFVVDLVEVSS
jgi:peptidylprolyl isomerase